jgi:hypothetical protein
VQQNFPALQLPQVVATPQLLDRLPHVLAPQVTLVASGVQQVLSVWQTLLPPQLALDTHWTHVPVVIWHPLRPMPLAAHCASLAHAEHRPPAQIGFDPLQLELARHSAHELVEVSQSGVVPLHCVALVAVHSAHAPLPAQAGAVAP